MSEFDATHRIYPKFRPAPIRMRRAKRFVKHVQFTALTVEQRREIPSLYLEHKMSMAQIAQHFGVSLGAIRNQLDMMNIERRDNSSARALTNSYRRKPGALKRRET